MTHLLRMESPFETEWGTLLLLEPADANISELRARLLNRSYDKPFMLDDGQVRYLYFTTSLMQSAMRLSTPNDLELRYTQQMMAALLFVPRPKNILLIGLGGGSLAKFCYARLPGAHFRAIEIDQHVINLRDAFLVPADDDRLEIIQGDGAAYLLTAEKGIDLLLVDAFDQTGFAPALANRDFFESAFKKLAGKGVLVVNLAGDPKSYNGLISEAMHVFDDQVIVVPVPEDGNHVLYAFKHRPFDPRWRWLHNYAKELRAHYGLDFPTFAEKLERADKLGFARREQVRGR